MASGAKICLWLPSTAAVNLEACDPIPSNTDIEPWEGCMWVCKELIAAKPEKSFLFAWIKLKQVSVRRVQIFLIWHGVECRLRNIILEMHMEIVRSGRWFQAKSKPQLHSNIPWKNLREGLSIHSICQWTVMCFQIFLFPLPLNKSSNVLWSPWWFSKS